MLNEAWKMQNIKFRQIFNAPVEQVFNALCDHENFGRLMGAKIERIVDGKAGYPNGLHSVRRIAPLPLLSFEETVISYEPNSLMEYKISKGTPLKNHKGRMQFSETEGKTVLDYQIEFDTKYPIPMMGFMLKNTLEILLGRAVKKLARSYL
ncbi:SRPBCC family protein [Oleiphilus messinensis]|nr:SRPBCC family protein [Oleiphilus messinensis]